MMVRYLLVSLPHRRALSSARFCTIRPLHRKAWEGHEVIFEPIMPQRAALDLPAAQLAQSSPD